MSINLLTWLDWVIIAIVALSTLISLWRGFTREALSLLGWVLAFIAANLFGGVLASELAGVIDNVTARYIAGWLLVFVGVLLAASLSGMLMARVVQMTGLGTLDRLLGTLFGFARGVVIVMVIVFVVRELVPPQEQMWLHHAQLMPQIYGLMDWSMTLLDQINLGPWPTISM